MTRTFQPLHCENRYCHTPWESGFVSRPTGVYCAECDRLIDWDNPDDWPGSDPLAAFNQTTREE